MTVHAGRHSQPSARVLRLALRDAGYTGRPINFGYVGDSSGFNARAGRASNKRLALRDFAASGVPTPTVYESVDDIQRYPVIGRPDRHRAGRLLFLCHGKSEVRRASVLGATHFLEFIPDAREFRVHIAFGRSIKIAEKVGGTGLVKNRQNGWYFAYPQDFNHKITLRRVAKEAVASIGLDFGAVDVLYSSGKFFVLEVNTAPALTSRSDALQRYVRAFCEEEC